MSGRPVIQGAFLEAIRAAVSPLDTEEARENYRLGLYPRSEYTKDVNKRYRWDLFWAARGSKVIIENDDTNVVITDAHIDTALRAIVPAL